MFYAYVSYDISRPSRSLAAYRVTLQAYSGDRPITGELESNGPTFNGIAVETGIFSTLKAAAAAVIAFIEAPCVLVERPYDEPAFLLMEHKGRLPGRVIASRLLKGTFVADV